MSHTLERYDRRADRLARADEPGGGSGLQDDPLLNQYIYVWKTQAGWSGTCRELQVLLVEGTMHTARFKLK